MTASVLFATFSLMTISQAAQLRSAPITISTASMSKAGGDLLIAARKKNRPKVSRKSPPIAKTTPAPTQPEYTRIPTPPALPAPTVTPRSEPEPELTVDVTGERKIDLPTSAPVYTIDRQQIDRQGAKNVADVLKNLPRFAINDVGYGADIHTGTYDRGASTNQFIILLNGRPIGTNVNTYHGAVKMSDLICMSKISRMFSTKK